MKNQVVDALVEGRRPLRRISTPICLLRWKPTVCVVAVLANSLSLFGQGTVGFRNRPGAGVTNCSWTLPCAAVGTAFSAGLYYGPDGQEPNQMLGPPARVGIPVPGYFDGGTRTTPADTPPGGYAMFQVKVWETAFGATYEEAVNTPGALVGVSSVMRVRTGGQGIPPTGPVQLPLTPIYVGMCQPGAPFVWIATPPGPTVAAMVGTSISFRAEAMSCCCLYGWAWYHNDVFVSGHTNGSPFGNNSTLVVAVRPESTGGYSVVASNSFGSRWAISPLRLRPVVTLSFTTNGNGTVTTSPSLDTYDVFTNVLVTATPAPGHELLKWSGDATGNANPLVLTMDTNKTITAHFALKPRLDVLDVEQAGGRLRLTGETNVVYAIEKSEDLMGWRPLLTVTNLAGTVDFEAPGVTNQSRFFKAVRFL